MSSPTTPSVPCPNCLSGYILPGEPSGKMVKAVSSSPEAYLASKHTKPSEGGRKKAIVLFTDIFGLPLVNCKIMADAFNERVGVDVYVPDLFLGKPPIKMEQLAPYTKDLPGEKLTWTEKFWAVLRLLSILPGFLANRPSIGDQRGEAVASIVMAVCHSIGVTDSVKAEQSFLGHMSTYMAATDLIKTSIIAHPGGLNATMVEAIKVPTLWQIPEEDEAMPEAFKKQTKGILEKKEGLAFEFTEYKGTRHGFAARPNREIPQIKQAYEDALDEAVEWFKKTL